jgi:hypothetical protein
MVSLILISLLVSSSSTTLRIGIGNPKLTRDLKIRERIIFWHLLKLLQSLNEEIPDKGKVRDYSR